jgi:integrase/recombinase XerD
MPRTARPPRLPGVLLEALFPSPQLLTGRLAASTVAMYTRDCAAYVAFCGYDGVVAVQVETLRRWRTYLVEDTRLSPHTINRMLAAVKRVLKEAAVQGSVERDGAGACAEVECVSVAAWRHRLKTTARVRLTPAQMRQLCEAPALSTLLGLRDRALLATLAGSGCRISEVVTLTVGQLSARDGGYVLQVLGKGQAAPREAPLSQEAQRHIQAWLAQRAAQGGVATPVIFTAFAGPRPTARRLTAGAAWCAVRKYALQCGLEHVKPHDFRRFVGTQLAKRDIRQAQKALGHKRLETTAQHYVLDELEVGLTDGLY